GFLGDGINDALALKAADVGISVDTAVDIAKESADLILLQKSLMILSDGVREGRRTFANILKYIRMGASSNFGNMLSMTGASLILPFLPMLPLQVLVNNFLYDLSQLAIPTDRVDESQTTGPRPWDIARLRSFMFFFGPISSLFDFLTFGVLLKIFHADAALFHTGWFMESIATQTLVIHVIRTEGRPWIDSRSSRPLLASSLGLLGLALALPFSPFAATLGFVRPPAGLVEAVAVLVIGYLFAVQGAKKIYVRRYGFN
ncbi:MAG TPA: cation transporting ATPase C-terminal domain-containing protein, partial [Elusimicrobiota bacterium]|nr:cation transporting ATPase C-terminal domain-containing protein [Elusimicrobiota bacterium]